MPVVDISGFELVGYGLPGVDDSAVGGGHLGTARRFIHRSAHHPGTNRRQSSTAGPEPSTIAANGALTAINAVHTVMTVMTE